MSILLRYLPLMLLAAGWELAARLGLVSQLALPPLSQVVLAWMEMLRSGELLTNGASSRWRGSAGLALAIVVGAALGIAMAWWRPINDIASFIKTRVMTWAKELLLIINPPHPTS